MKHIRKAIAALLAALSVVLTLASCRGSFDYMKKDLTKYLKLKRSDYIGVKVELTDDYSVTDSDVEDALLALRIANRSGGKTGSKIDTLTWGYDAHIYYWGTYEHENGQTVQFSGGSNMTASEPSKLTLGSGSFIDGFESGLVDLRVCPVDTYREYHSTKGLEIGITDIVYLEIAHYRYTDAAGKETVGSFSGLRFDPSDPGALGVDFARAITALKTGDEFDFGYASFRETEPLMIDWNGDGVKEELVLSGSVSALSPSERSVAVTATFPEDYGEESLQGKTATFHVVIDSVDTYDVPSERELTEKMVQKTYADFKSEETGDAFLAAVRAHLRAALTEAEAERRESDIESKLWAYLMDTVRFTGKLPKKALKENRAEIKAEMENEYAYYKQVWSQQYGIELNSFGEFANLFYDIEKGKTWKDYLETRAKRATREEILVYSIIRAEKWDLTDAEYEAGKARILAEYMEEYPDMDEDEIFRQIGKTAIYESVLFDKLLAKLAENAEVTEK